MKEIMQNIVNRVSVTLADWMQSICVTYCMKAMKTPEN